MLALTSSGYERVDLSFEGEQHHKTEFVKKCLFSKLKNKILFPEWKESDLKFISASEEVKNLIFKFELLNQEHKIVLSGDRIQESDDEFFVDLTDSLKAYLIKEGHVATKGNLKTCSLKIHPFYYAYHPNTLNSHEKPEQIGSLINCYRIDVIYNQCTQKTYFIDINQTVIRDEEYEEVDKINESYPEDLKSMAKQKYKKYKLVAYNNPNSENTIVKIQTHTNKEPFFVGYHFEFEDGQSIIGDPESMKCYYQCKSIIPLPPKIWDAISTHFKIPVEEIKIIESSEVYLDGRWAYHIKLVDKTKTEYEMQVPAHEKV